jgi:hypothetical protein
MRFRGKVFKNKQHWLAEIPLLDAMTQGRSRAEAFKMAADLVESLAGHRGFKVYVHAADDGSFEVASKDIRTMVALLLRRQRELSGLTLAQAAQRLGAKSRNAYARYEQGVAVPTIEKLNELLAAVSPGRDFVIQESNAGV